MYCSRKNKNTYHVIYEHKNIYDSLAGGTWDEISEYVDKLIDVQAYLKEHGYGHIIVNPFDIRNTSDKITWEMFSRTPKIEDSEEVKEDFRKRYNTLAEVKKDLEYEGNTCSIELAIGNILRHSTDMLALYNKQEIDIAAAKEDIVSFVNFLFDFDNTFYGHFYYSVYANQSWHHDNGFYKKLKEYGMVFNRQIDLLKKGEE